MPVYQPQAIALDKLKPYARNARTHSKKQIAQIAASISSFGFVVPILTDENLEIIAGHGRLAAARSLGLASVPVMVVSDLSPAKKRALRLADNKIPGNAGWDRAALHAELKEIDTLLALEDLDIEITGFVTPEIDQLCTALDEGVHPSDYIVPKIEAGPPVSKTGDLWLLGDHRLLVGNARSADDVAVLMDGHIAAAAFLDPPYNLTVKGIVGRGKTKHAEFGEASGEMSADAFIAFLKETLGNAAAVSDGGALHFVCMDWRHAGELITASKAIYGAHINTAVWVKSNAGQGSLYRSQHEEVFVFRTGSQPHVNNVELGRHGRNRTNVWNYPGMNSFGRGRMDRLRMHPTVKPVALIADAIKDCTRRGEIVIDFFAGSGTTILAAEEVGRVAYTLELDPQYVDVAVKRWQSLTRKDAVLAGTNDTFTEVSEGRNRTALTESASNERK